MQISPKNEGKLNAFHVVYLYKIHRTIVNCSNLGNLKDL